MQQTYMKKLAWAFIVMLMLPFISHAQANVKEQETVKVYFRVGSRSIDPTYMNNAEALKQLTALLEPYVLDSTRGKGRIHIMASASPEGSLGVNKNLIELRSKAIADWIGKRFHVEVGYEVDLMGIDWNSLESMVEQSDEVPSKADVLHILRNTPEEGLTRQYQLEKLHNGTPYRWIAKHFYPMLRYGAVRTEIWYASEIRITTPSPMYFEAEGGSGTITFEKNVEDMVVPTVRCKADWIKGIIPTGKDITFSVDTNKVTIPRSTTIYIECYGNTYPVEVHQKAAEPEPEPIVAPEPVIVQPDTVVVEKPACKHDLFWSVSNNGVYDLLLIPNIGAELYLGKDWSVDANWHYSWWKTDKRHRYWRTYGGDLSIRKWFGKAAKLKPLTGHHVGVYGQMLTYDIEFGNRGYLADRWSWAVGFDYGYSLPIARRLNLDFAIGIGYHWGNYDEYLPIDDHYVWQETKKRNYIGPTKVEVSLVWLLGCDNYNRGKGGKR